LDGVEEQFEGHCVLELRAHRFEAVETKKRQIKMRRKYRSAAHGGKKKQK